MSFIKKSCSFFLKQIPLTNNRYAVPNNKLNWYSAYSVSTSMDETSPKEPPGHKKNWKEYYNRDLKIGNDRWRPQKRLTSDKIDHLKNLKMSDPEKWDNKLLAKTFGISFSAVVRILKSKFEGTPEMRARQDAKAKEQARIRKANFMEQNQSISLETPSPSTDDSLAVVRKLKSNFEGTTEIRSKEYAETKEKARKWTANFNMEQNYSSKTPSPSREDYPAVERKLKNNFEGKTEITQYARSKEQARKRKDHFNIGSSPSSIESDNFEVYSDTNTETSTTLYDLKGF